MENFTQEMDPDTFCAVKQPLNFTSTFSRHLFHGPIHCEYWWIVSS